MWQLKKLWSPSLKLWLMMIPVLVLTGFLAVSKVSPWQSSRTTSESFANNLKKFPSNVSVQTDVYQEDPAAVRLLPSFFQEY